LAISNKNIKFKSNKKNKRVNYKWIIIVTIVTFFIAMLLGYISLIYMEKVTLAVSIGLLFIIVLIGVFFDALGIAVTAADEIPFHSMAANKVKASKESILLIRNASTVANFFNDVIGDISGIISGAATGAIVIKINEIITIKTMIISILLSAIVAALTVGGKAIGKEFALRKANSVVYKIGLVINFFTNIKSNIASLFNYASHKK